MDIENKIVQACNALPVAFAPAEKSIDSLIEAINKWRAHVLSDTVGLKNNSNKFEDDAKSLRIERDALRDQPETTKRELMATDISWQNALAELQKVRESAPAPAMPMQDDQLPVHGNTIVGDVTVRIDGVGEFICNDYDVIPIPKQEPVFYADEDFNAGQWWVGELNDATKNGTPDQQRAYRVVMNLLRQVKPAQTAAIPEGWQLVPIEPTREMIEGFWGEIKHCDDELLAAHEAYYQMLSASPKP